MFETILVWCFIIGFFILSAYFIGDDSDIYRSKAEKDLDETMLNRNENMKGK